MNKKNSHSIEKQNRKIAKEHLDYGCGFLVRLINVPMIKDETGWIPDLDYNRLDKAVLLEICKRPFCLTGNQVRFIRLFFEKTLEDFASTLRVKHSSIIHWEKQKDNIAKITWGTELAIRLFVLFQLDPRTKQFHQDYALLMEREIVEDGSVGVDLDAQWLVSSANST